MRSIAFLLALIGCAHAHGAAAGVSFPGGVADARGEHAYVDGASGGVEAIALSSGATAWRAATAFRPLALAGRRLLALTASRRPNELRFVVLDAGDGKVLATSPVYPLPSWVSVAPAWAHSFDCHAHVDGEQAIVVWHATAAWSQGMHPQEGQEAAARHEQSGAIAVDLADAGVRAHALPPTAPPATATQLPTLDGHHLLERRARDWAVLDATSHESLGTVAIADGFREPSVIGARLYLVRDGEGLQAIDLATGRVRWQHRLPRPASLPAPQ
jgi:hypothetical protein